MSTTRSIMALALAAAASFAITPLPAEEELPAFKRALPARYFECRSDNECVMVQGWCATFAINKAFSEAYEKIPADPAGKAAGKCPPGWLPPRPRPACIQNQCTIERAQTSSKLLRQGASDPHMPSPPIENCLNRDTSAGV